MRYAKFLLLLILIVALLPYLYTCFYALPFADDFCFGWTASEKVSFAHKFLKQYLHWNGRYTSDVLVNFHPLITGSLFRYQLAAFAAILAFPCVLFLFIRHWVKNSFISHLATLIISVFYLCYQPNITEGVYWYIGMVNYHLASLCLILQVIVLLQLLQSNSHKIFLLPASLLLLVFSIGFNEVGAALIPAYYLAALIYCKANQASQAIDSQNRNILLSHFAVAFIASLFVIFSPGNCMRANIFPDRFNFFHSTLYASLQTVRFIGLWCLSLPFIALSLVVVAKADNIKPGFIKNTDYRVLLALLAFTVFMGAFLPYMATGILGQHRTLNYVFPFFIILWLATLISASHKYQLYLKLKPAITDLSTVLLLIISIAVMVISGNSGKIIRDNRSGIFRDYKSEFMQRQALILRQPSAPINSLKNIPGVFEVVDTRGDTTWWVDVCMKRFYTETDIVLK
jgi:hypothetical protein